MIESKLVAKWISRSGKHWIELYTQGPAAWYKAPDCGGSLGVMDAESAIKTMQSKVDAGLFQPDANTTPMRRVL